MSDCDSSRSPGIISPLISPTASPNQPSHQAHIQQLTGGVIDATQAIIESHNNKKHINSIQNEDISNVYSNISSGEYFCNTSDLSALPLTTTCNTILDSCMEHTNATPPPL